MPWIKCHRSFEAGELLRSNPNAFVVLYLIASRAWRGGAGNPRNLSRGEASIGDYASCGLTRAKYRTALKELERMKYITTKPTNKGTIAKLLDTTVFDPNLMSNEVATTNNAANKINSNNQQIATNKKDKNYKKYNNVNEDKSPNYEHEKPGAKTPKKLSMWVLKNRKEACETELKQLRDRGSEYAMGFEYDSKQDKLRAIELKTKIKELNRAMQNAEG